MSVKIGHASQSEHGSANGTKGDSTGKEVCTRAWYKYSGGWDFVAIYPDADVREKHAKAVEQACANDNIGYGQNDRNTLHTQAVDVAYVLSKIAKTCNCDCSSLQHVAAIASGAMPESSYGSNGMTTSTMKSVLQSYGYIIITDSTYCNNESYCVRGAIYVKSGHHTVTGLDNGSNYTKTLAKAGLSTSTTSTNKSVALTVDGEAGKKTVKRWQNVMGTTYDGIISGQDSAQKKYWAGIIAEACKWNGGTSQLVKAWQKYLIGKGYSCGKAGADGELGYYTAVASQKFLIAQGYACGSAGADGKFATYSVKALQRWLNDQK